MQITQELFKRVVSAVSASRGGKCNPGYNVVLALHALGGRLICHNRKTVGDNYLTEVEYGGTVFQHSGPDQIPLEETFCDEERRRGEIALLMVKHRIFKQGIPGDGFHRDLGNMAKEIGIRPEEMQDFYESILPEVIGKLFRRKKVGITMGDKTTS